MHHLPVRRTARYYTLGSDDADEVWFVLHGYGQQARFFVRHFRPHAGDERCIVAPEALSRFYLDDAYSRIGASWLTREDREADIADTIAYLDTLAAHVLAPHQKAHVLGFSQGTSVACRWAAFGSVRFEQVVLWAGDVPGDLDLGAHGDALRTLTLVVGERDEIATPGRIADVATRLETGGVPHRTLRYDGGHRLHAETLARLFAPSA